MQQNSSNSSKLRVNKADFQEWLEEPVTQAVFRFIHDLRRGIREDEAYRFENEGYVSDPVQEAIRQAFEKGRSIMAQDLEALAFSDLEAFYEDSDEDQTSVGAGSSRAP